LSLRFQLLAIVVLLGALADPVLAQGATGGVGPSETFRPLRLKRHGPAPPPVAFHEVGRIPLPAPAAGGRIAVDDDGSVAVLLQDGWVRTVPAPGAEAERLSARPAVADTVDPTAWVHGGRRGKRRVRVEPDGDVRAERRSSFGGPDRHVASWRLRLTGRVAGPPLVAGGRAYVGSSDNRVYALRLRNGHRMWTRDLDARISRPLAMWSGELASADPEAAAPVSADVLLVVPDDGRRLIALDPHDGSTLGEFVPAGDQERIISGAAVLPDGSIAVVRRGWREDDVGIAVLRIEAAEQPRSASKKRR